MVDRIASVCYTVNVSLCLIRIEAAVEGKFVN
jgi:hypothetical protein